MISASNTLAVEKIIYCEVDQKRFLPYSILFDLLTYFANQKLNQTISHTLATTLPNKSQYKNEIDLWVDMECLGDITVIMAKSLANVIANYIQEKTIIHINLPKKMSRENQFFIHYLQLLSSHIEVTYGDIIHLKTDWGPHDTAYLQWPCFGMRTAFDYHKEIASIFCYAWRCAELGAEEVGFHLLKTGQQEIKDAYLQQLYCVQLQCMRVATQHYAAAAAETKEFPVWFEDLLRLFNLMKAWGSILSRQIEQAQHYFQLAKVTIDDLPTDIDSLYRMNVFALFQQLSGLTENAITIEKKIEKAICALKKPRPQITYINFINLARLYRHQGDHEKSKHYYDKAFLHRGIKSETDAVYQQTCYALLYEKQEQYEVALQYWLNAAMKWLSLETPEALGWRVVRALALPNFKPRTYLDTDSITQALIIKLIKLAQLTGRPFTQKPENENKAKLAGLVISLLPDQSI